MDELHSIGFAIPYLPLQPWNSEIDAPPADFTYIVEDDFDLEKKATKKEKTKNKVGSRRSIPCNH
jgi:hypothetical protein